MKTYQIYIDSSEGTVISSAERNFKFDWNILPEGEYEMTFSFVSQLQKLTNAEAEATTYANSVEINIPFSSNSYKVSNTDGLGFALGTFVSGLLELKDQHKTSGHTVRILVADTALNPPVTLYGKPQGMDFNVRLLQHGDGDAVNAPNYNMIIYLKHKC